MPRTPWTRSYEPHPASSYWVPAACCTRPEDGSYSPTARRASSSRTCASIDASSTSAARACTRRLDRRRTLLLGTATHLLLDGRLPQRFARGCLVEHRRRARPRRRGERPRQIARRPGSPVARQRHVLQLGRLADAGIHRLRHGPSAHPATCAARRAPRPRHRRPRPTAAAATRSRPPRTRPTLRRPPR